MYTRGLDKKVIRGIEKLVNIVSVSEKAAYQGICNSLKVGDVIFNASILPYIDSGHKWYDFEVQKNKELEAACDKIGLELMYFNLSEAMKSGALLSCFAMHLNYRDMY